MGEPPDITRALESPGAAERVLPLVYEQLRELARARMARERKDHTLSATALVHEAYARLVGGREIAWASRAQFFHAAAEAMRRILVEYARQHGAVKRGGDWTRCTRSVQELVAQDPGRFVSLEEAFRRLEGVDPRAAEVVRLRFYAGLSVEETASALGVSARSVNRDWEYARAWLLEAVEQDGSG